MSRPSLEIKGAVCSLAVWIGTALRRMTKMPWSATSFTPGAMGNDWYVVVMKPSSLRDPEGEALGGKKLAGRRLAGAP